MVEPTSNAATGPLQRVLIVDDDQTIRDLIRDYVAQWHPEVVDTADNGARAWAMLEEQHYDLVVLDWKMPVMSGMALFNRIRSTAKYLNTPVLVSSGLLRSEDFRLLDEYPCTRWINKPYAQTLFAEVFTSLIGDATWYRQHEQAVASSIMLMQRDRSQGLGDLMTLLKSHKNPVPVTIMAARTLPATDGTSEALLRAVLKKDPESVPALFELGKLVFRAKRYDEALEILALAQRLSPKNLSRSRLMGEIALNQGKNKVAADHFGNALKIDPQDSKSSLGLSISKDIQGYQAQHDGKGAVNQSLAAMINLLAIAEVMQGRYAAGIKRYEEAIDFLFESNDRGRIAFNLGLAYKRWGRDKEALPWFIKADQLCGGTFEKARRYLDPATLQQAATAAKARPKAPPLPVEEAIKAEDFELAIDEAPVMPGPVRNGTVVAAKSPEALTPSEAVAARAPAAMNAPVAIVPEVAAQDVIGSDIMDDDFVVEELDALKADSAAPAAPASAPAPEPASSTTPVEASRPSSAAAPAPSPPAAAPATAPAAVVAAAPNAAPAIQGPSKPENGQQGEAKPAASKRQRPDKPSRQVLTLPERELDPRRLVEVVHKALTERDQVEAAAAKIKEPVGKERVLLYNQIADGWQRAERQLNLLEWKSTAGFNQIQPLLDDLHAAKRPLLLVWYGGSDDHSVIQLLEAVLEAGLLQRVGILVHCVGEKAVIDFKTKTPHLIVDKIAVVNWNRARFQEDVVSVGGGMTQEAMPLSRLTAVRGLLQRNEKLAEMPAADVERSLANLTSSLTSQAQACWVFAEHLAWLAVSKRLDEGAGLAAKVLQKWPDSFLLRLASANLATLNGDPSALRQLGEWLHGKDKASPERLFRIGSDMLRHQMLQDLQTLILDGISKDILSNNYQGYCLTGQLLLLEEDFDNAARCFEAAIELNPLRWECLFGYAEALLALKELRPALQIADVCLQCVGVDVTALRLLRARCLVRDKQWKEADSVVAQVLAEDPNNSHAIALLAQVKERKVA